MRVARAFALILSILSIASCKTRESALQADRPSGSGYVSGNPAHFQGPFTIEGPWDLDPEAIQRRYNGLQVSQFGSVGIMLAPGVPVVQSGGLRPTFIRELHYQVAPGRVGIHPIPVADRKWDLLSTDADYPQPASLYWKDYPPRVATADGTEVRGSELIDQQLRISYGFNPTDKRTPIFALAAFAHAENYNLNFSDLASSSAHKTENSMSHLTAYLGDGITRNAPIDYHEMRWRLTQDDAILGYPANVYILKAKAKGLDQETLIRNIFITLRLLNELNDGPVFPPNYHFDWVQTINLEETLAFYRGWLDRSWKRNPTDKVPYLDKLKNDEYYNAYCAEHLTIVLNVAFNLVQTEQGYIDVWGPDEGKKLFNLAKSRYEHRERLVRVGENFVTKELGANATSRFPSLDYTKFVPLWRLHGIQNPAGEKTINRGLFFPLATTADLIAYFIEQYAAWPDVGAALSSAAILGFLPEAVKRTGIKMELYLDFAGQMIVSTIKHAASTQRFASSGDIEKAYLTYLDQVFNGVSNGQSPQPGLRQLAAPLASQAPGGAKFLDTLESQLKAKETVDWIKANNGKDINTEAWPAFRADIKQYRDLARDVGVAVPEGTYNSVEDPETGKVVKSKNVRFYTQPSIVHLMANGLHPYASDYVEVKPVATVFDARELRNGSGPFRMLKVGE